MWNFFKNTLNGWEDTTDDSVFFVLRLGLGFDSKYSQKKKKPAGMV